MGRYESANILPVAFERSDCIRLLVATGDKTNGQGMTTTHTDHSLDVAVLNYVAAILINQTRDDLDRTCMLVQSTWDIATVVARLGNGCHNVAAERIRAVLNGDEDDYEDSIH